MAKPIQRYWDSDCFLGWFNDEPDKVPLCKGIVERAHKREIELVVSAITLVEVIKLKGKPRLKESAEKTIKDFFENDFILLVNVDRHISEFARQLIWDHSALNPKDAIHVATAILKNVSTLNTFDNYLIKLSERFELANNKEKLKICKPDIQTTGDLFEGQ